MFSPTDDECTELIRAYYRAAGEVAKVSAKQFSDPAQAAVAMLMAFQAVLVSRMAIIGSSSQQDAVEKILEVSKGIKFVGGAGKEIQ